MIIQVWKPIYKNSKAIYFTLVDNETIYNSGTTGYRVLWLCDGKNCKYPNVLHSIGRGHLTKKRSLTCNDEIQICKSCQNTGYKNPKFGDNRTWNEIMGLERSMNMKERYKNNFIENNPSKLDDVKKKKGQLIITLDSVSKLMDENYTLLSLDGYNKHSVLSIECPNKHIFIMKYHSWRSGSRCQKCYYESLRLTDYEIEQYKDYSTNVRLLTNQTYRKYKHILDPNKIKSSEYHLDHIYSVHDGFKNNINPLIISSVHNLRLVEASENLLKGSKSDITIEELKNKYLLMQLHLNLDENK